MDNFTFLTTRLDANDLAPTYERLREEYGIVKIAQFRINAAVKGRDAKNATLQELLVRVSMDQEKSAAI